MADAMEGIMGLPQSNGPAAVDFPPEAAVIESYAQNNPDDFNRNIYEAIGEQDPRIIAQLRAELQGLQLTSTELDALKEAIQRILLNPQDYKEIRAELIRFGLDPEDLPEEYDGPFFQMLAVVLSQMEGTPEPQAFADGGIAELNPVAQALGAQGRYGDTMVAHINPQEAAMLQRMGGSGTINPVTGLPEFGFFSKIFKSVKKVFKKVTKVVKKALQNKIVRAVATIALGAFIGPTVMSLTGLTGTAAMGVTAGLASTAVNLASGQSLGDALKGGVIAGATAWAGGELFGVPDQFNPNVQQAGPQASGVQTGGTGAPVTGPTELTTLAPGVDATGAAIPQANLGNYVNQGGMTLDEGLGFLTPDEVMTQATMAQAPVDMASYGASSMMAEPAATFGSQAGSQVADLSANAANYAQGMSSVAPSTGLTTAPSALTTPTNVPTMADFSSAATPANPMYDFSNMQPAVDLSSAGTTGQYLTGNTASNFAPVTETSYLDKLMSEPLNTVKETATDFYDDYLSPTTNKFTGTGTDMTVDEKFLELKNNPQYKGVDQSVLYKMAEKAAAPSMLSTIGSWAPLAVAGTGVAAGLGAFETPPPPELPEWAKGPTGAELLEQDPEKYGLNWGGVRTTYADLYNKGISGYGSPDNPYTAAIRGYTQPTYAANGGEMTSFPRMNGHISGPGTGTSDDVPAMLSDGEFVMTANAVRGAGNGSRRAGAKKMYALMKALENRTA